MCYVAQKSESRGHTFSFWKFITPACDHGTVQYLPNIKVHAVNKNIILKDPIIRGCVHQNLTNKVTYVLSVQEFIAIKYAEDKR